MKDPVRWMDMGPYPVCNVGLVTSRRSWNLARSKHDFESDWTSEIGHTYWFNHRPDDCFILVAFDGIKSIPRDEAIGLVAHEAVHVWQYVCEYIRAGSSKSREIEAYSVQWIVTWIAKELRL